MGERRPAQFSGGGLPNETKFYGVPSIVELGNMSLYVHKPVTNEDDEVRHYQNRRYCERTKMNSEASASFKITAGGSDRSDVIARENPFYQFNSRVQNLNFKTRYNSQVSL